jgi:putative permease
MRSDSTRTEEEQVRREEPPGSALFRTLVRTLLLAAALVVVVWFAYRVRTALLLFLVAIVGSIVLNAPVTWLERRRLSRGIATLVVMACVLALIGLLGWLIVPRLIAELPTLIEELPALLEELTERAAALLGGHPEIDRQLSQLVTWFERGLGEVWRVLDAVGAALLAAVVVFALVLYIVANPRPLLRWYVELMPAHLREPAARAIGRSSKMVVGWVLANAILGGMKATAAFVFLQFMEVPGAIIWSVLALFSALIPRLGFYLMSIPPVIVALTVSPATALWTALYLWVLSEILGNFVAPHVQGEIMELHAAYLLFMTVAMGLAFGLLGVLVASPLAGFIKVYYDEFYLARQSEDPQLEERVDGMMEGALEGVRGLRESLRFRSRSE